jgi:hypothetical protein
VRLRPVFDTTGAQRLARVGVPPCRRHTPNMSSSWTNISSWSSDGFGHQLMAMLSCQAVALSQNRTRYIPAVHTRMEHSPPNATELLSFLSSFPAGREAPAPMPNMEKPRFPDCAQTHGVRVCDHCFGRSFGTLGCSVALSMPQRTHATLLHRMHASLRLEFPGRSCPARDETETLCVHWRQKAGWESRNWIKNRVFPKSTLTTMIRAVQRNMTSSNTTSVVVYTNADASDSQLPLPHVRSADENPLSILFEFTFCCDGIVLSNSALSAVIGFATNVPRSRIGGHTSQCLPLNQNWARPRETP